MMYELRAPLVKIRMQHPLELVCMDYLSLEPDSKGTKKILVIIIISFQSSFHQICSSSSDSRSKGEDSGESTMEQLFHPLWFSRAVA